MRIKTEVLQDLCKKITPSVGNSLLPIADYIKIELQDCKLLLSATDGSHFLTVYATVEDTSDFIAIVEAEAFLKIPAKTNKEFITMQLMDKYLEVKGNGKYKVAILADNDYPKQDNLSGVLPQKVTIDVAEFNKICLNIKSAISLNPAEPRLSGYYWDSSIVTTDSVKIFSYSMPCDTRMLLTSKTIEMLKPLSGSATVYNYGNLYCVQGENFILYAPPLIGLEKYPDISSIINLPTSNSFQINRQELLAALDRISVFTNNNTNKAIHMRFSDDELMINDLDGKSLEQITVDNTEIEPFRLVAKYFMDIVKAFKEDNLTIYTNKSFIKITEGKLTGVLGMVVEVVNKDSQ